VLRLPCTHHAGGLAKTAIPRRAARRQRHQTALRNEQLVGHPTVAHDADDHRRLRAAQIVVADRAELAAAAGDQRLDRPWPATAPLSGDLMPDRHRRVIAVLEHVQTRAADAGRTDPHVDSIAFWPRNVDDLDVAVVHANGAHAAVTPSSARTAR